MIKFYIITDDLFYKTQMERTIKQVVQKEKYEIEYKYSEVNTNENRIYLIDLEFIKDIEVLYHIRELDSINPIIILTSKKEKVDIWYTLDYCTIIDKEENYLKELQEAIVSSINHHVKNLVIDQKDLKLAIPLQELSSIDNIKNQHIIEGTKKNGKKYKYTVVFNNKENEYLQKVILDKKCKNIELYYCNSHMIIYNEKIQNKTYSEKLKTEIVTMYQKGISVSYLTRKYNISPSTIYLWIRKDKVEKKLTDYEQIHNKLKEIREIMDSK